MDRRELLLRAFAAGALAVGAGAANGAGPSAAAANGATAGNAGTTVPLSDEGAGPQPGESPRPRGAGRKALFVYGGWEGHEPAKCRDLWVPWLESKGFAVLASDSLAPYADPALMKTVDLIVQVWTQGEIPKDQLAGLLAAVKDGAGLAGWHGGLADAFRKETDYQFMVGGQWVAHPGGIVDYEVKIVDHDDEVTRGVRDFRVQSEQYYMHVDPNNKVLATTTFSAAHAPWIAGATMPVVWKRVHGRGRVFYTSVGHRLADFAVPEVLEIARRGILWASESRYAETERLVAPVYPAR